MINIPRELIDELKKDLVKRNFTHFVTLAINDMDISVDRARNRLREWDARINYKLIGKRWHKRPDERMFWVFFLEKLETNPHWHGLVQLLPDQSELFLEVYSGQWQKLVMRGSADATTITSQAEVVNYVTKELKKPISYTNFIVSWEFSSK